MSTKYMGENSASSGSSSSPEDSFVYLTPALVRDTEDKVWRSCFSVPDLLTPHELISETSHSTPDMSNPVNFLYDYYGMTEESRQDPPSPGRSSVASADDKYNSNEGIDIPERKSQRSRRSPPALYSLTQGVESPELRIGGHRQKKADRAIAKSFSEVTGKLLLPLSTHIAPKRSQSVTSFKGDDASTSPPQTPEMMLTRNTFSYVKQPSFAKSEKYVFTLEAQTSVVQKRNEDSLTYLNKGQFYFLTFEAPEVVKSRIKSIIHLVFREEKEEAVQQTHWKYWFNQQPNPNQRAVDIDKKACQNINNDTEECGYNAHSFTWTPGVKARVSLRINCLSTDFTPQKGVKGFPLHLQIDTYEDLEETAQPIHQAFCKIKVFRDKGAERKNKEESKTVGKRMVKYLKQGTDPANANADLSPFQMANKVTVLTNCPEPITKSFVYIPSKETPLSPSFEHTPPLSPGSGGLIHKLKERDTKRSFNNALSNANEFLENLDVYPKHKTPRVIKKKEIAVTIYVRKEEEKAYNALLLETATIDDLKDSISLKYNIPAEMIKSIYKNTKKGILVNMDDQLVERFVDEDDFIIAIHFDNHQGFFEVFFDS